MVKAFNAKKERPTVLYCCCVFFISSSTLVFAMAVVGLLGNKASNKPNEEVNVQSLCLFSNKIDMK